MKRSALIVVMQGACAAGYAAAQVGMPSQPAGFARCGSVRVVSMEVKRRAGDEILPKKPTAVVYRRAPLTEAGVQGFQVSALGPVLGNMDSQDIKVSTTCSGQHIELLATVVRSAEYGGSVQKYAPWRPEILLVVASRRGVELTTTWRMLSTSGAEVFRGDLPD